MPWKIVKNDSGCSTSKPWGVRKESDNSLEGCHASEADAQAHMRALYANESVEAPMKYSIRQTDDGWEIVNGDGDVLATFVTQGTYEQPTDDPAYNGAVAQLGALVTEAWTERIAAAAGDGLLPEHWWSDGDGIAYCEALPGGRDFTNCLWSWRDPAQNIVPLMLQTKNEAGHWGAELAGFVEKFSGGGQQQVDVEDGRFYDSTAGMQARDLLLGGRRFGVSVDPSEQVDAELECIEFDEYGCIEEAVVFKSYEIAGLTMVPFPGFGKASIQMKNASDEAIAAAATAPAPTAHEYTDANSDGTCDVCGMPMADHGAIAASLVIPPEPPREWFELGEPRLGEPFLDGLGDDVLVPQGRDGASLACPFKILDNGQVFAHLTYWGQCHLGNPWGRGRCASVSRSSNEYVDFHKGGYVLCDDGTELPTGLLHVGCEHSAEMSVSGVRDAAAHAGLAFAQVRVYDGEYGPWMCGSLLPDVTPEQVVRLRALTLSGEWVPELGAIIAVNDGGLPQQRKIAASAFGTVVELPVAQAAIRASMTGDVVTKIVGGNLVRQCPECAKRARASLAASNVEVLTMLATRFERIERMMADVERRTRHLIPTEAEATRASLRLEAS